LTEHTGVTREARSLSGVDRGRWLTFTEHGDTIQGPILSIEHSQYGNTWAYIGDPGDCGIDLDPTDVVTIRGRDE
jgi:hypothetical protein